MTSTEDRPPQPPPTDIDTAYPILTREVSTTTPTSRSDGPVAGQAAQAISDVLGWKWRDGDTNGFVAALTGSFTLSRVEGHTDAKWTPRGYAVQADLGAVTGAQASLAARARTAVKDSGELLDSLTPLRVDFNKEVAEGFRALVHHDLDELRKEFESPLIRVPRVDQIFSLLLFVSDQPTQSSVAGGGPVTIDPDTVGGHLGMVRDAFGLIPDFVDSVGDERVQTSYITIVDWVASLYYSWQAQRGKIDPFTLPPGSQGYFGPALVALSQLLAATASQVDELTDAFDSVLVNAGEREVLRVPIPGGGTMPLGGLLRWISDFATTEGQQFITSAGKDGVDSAFTQVVKQLVSIVVLLPSAPGGQPALPPGFYSRRVQIGIDSLIDDLNEVVSVAAPVRHPDDNGSGSPRAVRASRALPSTVDTSAPVQTRRQSEPDA